MNAIMKVIWNQCLDPAAEKAGMLSPVQFGSRKGRTALDALLLKSLGLPEKAAKCSVLLNHDMKHHVKTQARVTMEFYKHEVNKEKFGEGQGKTSSPSNWLFQ
eukprot:13632050-Ditylum_brightwellii.AAC.1